MLLAVGCRPITIKWIQEQTGRSSSVNNVSAIFASGPEINPCMQHILSLKFFTSSPDYRRASCQLMAKNWL